MRESAPDPEGSPIHQRESAARRGASPIRRHLGRSAPSGYPAVVPRYDFRCRDCASTFEVTRPMSASGQPAPCPDGHVDTVKLLTTVAVGGLAGTGGTPAPARAGGGCCGGGCCG